MLTHLHLQNFKAWKDSGRLRLAPLTVLFGTNSAGKTSIPQLLLLLRQTAESPDRQRALHLGDGRSLVDVGTYDDVVHGHDVKNPVRFTLGWRTADPVRVVDALHDKEFEGDAIEFSATLTADENHQPRVQSFEYGALLGGERVLDVSLTRRDDRKRQRKDAEFDLTSRTYELTRQSGRPWPLPGPVRFYGLPDEVAAYYQNAAFASDLVLELERMLKSIYYVGPLREYPRRLYLWSGEVPDHVGTRGERAIEAILAAGERAFNWKAKQKTKSLRQLVAERLRSMGFIDSFEVKRLAEHRKEYEVAVRTNPQQPEVKLTDVGFGVSQVLPVIAECFYVPARSIVIFEQPEIHLHPRVQADLADLFVDAIRAREDGQPRDCQFIIESHSEHFLRRLQRRIAEEELSKDDAALYFVRTEGAAARIEELDVDDYGNIRNWPEGFFGDEMADLVARPGSPSRPGPQIRTTSRSCRSRPVTPTTHPTGSSSRSRRLRRRGRRCSSPSIASGGAGRSRSRRSASRSISCAKRRSGRSTGRRWARERFFPLPPHATPRMARRRRAARGQGAVARGGARAPSGRRGPRGKGRRRQPRLLYR